MPSLKRIPSAGAAERRYVAKRFVYVESEDDVRILGERWFIDKGDRVEFLSAGDGGPGGCTRVPLRVQEDRNADIDAVGIVDRDALARESKWLGFFETDDAKLEALEPFGEGVMVLRCWEIENYLLHPRVVETFLSDELGKSERPLEKTLEGLFDIACRLIPILAADLILNQHGKAQNQIQIGLGQTFEDIYKFVRRRIEDEIAVQAAQDLDRFIEKLVVFSEDAEHRSLDHWLKLLRIVDGKRFIRWLCHQHQLGERDIRWHLARLTRDQGLVSHLLDPAVQSIAA